MRAAALPLLFAAGLGPVPALAQATPGQDGILEEVVVRSTRIEQTLERLPLAVSVVEARDIQLARQQLGIDEALNRVPGVFFQDRYNFNQDLRISIRGFGAQAQFGIVGLHLTVDGVPVTTPDGTSQVDDLDMGSMGRVEVVRGPSAALYGTSAGGAINMYTEEPPDQPYLEARAMVGEYDTAKYQLKTAGRHDRLGYLASVQYMDVGGFRDFADAEATVFNTKVDYDVDDSLRISAVAAGVHSPRARDPGALTPTELASGPPSQARSLNVRCNVREKVDQYRGGVVLSKQFNEAHGLRLRAYGLSRDFDANLPCPFVDQTAFERSFYGGGAEYAFSGALAGRPLRVVSGFELSDQEDDRQRWNASATGERGALSGDQFERVDTASVYALAEWAVGERWLLSAGGRYQSLDFELDDRFAADGDNSDDTSYSEFTPMAGVTFAAGARTHVYASVSTSFETPTFAQLGDPDGPGINTDLSAQTSSNYEVGVKGLLVERLRYSVALFHIDLDDQLVPFEQNDDVFYRNAGRTRRDGLEASLDYRLSDAWGLTLAYTLSDFEFEDYVVDGEVLDGNDNPGVPENQLYAELSYVSPRGWYGFLDVLHVGRLYADERNTSAARVDPYQLANLRLGRRLGLGSLQADAFVGVNNLFDEDYFANVRINQSFDRYFEPGPGRHYYGGLTVRF